MYVETDQFERVIYPSAAVLLCLLVVLSVLAVPSMPLLFI